jgi:hypothetical protein
MKESGMPRPNDEWMDACDVAAKLQWFNWFKLDHRVCLWLVVQSELIFWGPVIFI